MVDPAPLDVAKDLATYGAAYHAVNRVFGGSLDAINDFLRTLTARRLGRVLKTIEMAEAKLRHDSPKDGTVVERVWECTFQAANSEDPWVMEYLSGVLASSRNSPNPDDRGARVSLAVAQLSAYQLRAHYAFYRIMRKELQGVVIEDTLDRSEMASNYRVFVPRRVIDAALDIEASDPHQVFSHSLWGLRQDHLLGLFAVGDVHRLREKGYDVDEPGLVISPYNVGIELFMWGHGAGYLSNAAYFAEDLSLRLLDAERDVRIDEGATRVPKPQREEREASEKKAERPHSDG